MANVVQALVQSRKAWVVLLAVVGVVAMELAGKIGSQQALDAIKWLVSAWLGAQAVEDAAGKMGRPSVGDTTVNVAQSTKQDGGAS